MSKKRFTRNLQVIPATIYPCNIYVFKGFTFKEAQKDLLEICPTYTDLIKGTEFNNPGYSFMFKDGSIVVLIHKDHVHDMNTIVHEAFHVTEFIMDYINCKLTDDTSEPFAYLIAYIVEQIIK